MAHDPQSSSLEAARENANLGLPIEPNSHFRLVKRAIAKMTWFLLRHQVDFNHEVLRLMRQFSEQQDAWFEGADARVDRMLREANQEIGDHVAFSQSALAEMQLRLLTLSHEVNERSGEHRNNPSDK